MNIVNRVVLVVLLLAAMLLCTTVMVVPVGVFDALARQFDAMADFLDAIRLVVRLPLGILFALVLDIILILLIVLEVRRPARKSIQVEKTAGGEVLIAVDSIADRLRYEIDQLPAVLRTKTAVSGRRGGVVVELDVEMATGINVPEKAEQMVETARQVVEEKMGLKLARPPKVNLRVVSYPKAPKPVPAPPTPSVREERSPSPLVPDTPVEGVEEFEPWSGGGSSSHE